MAPWGIYTWTLHTPSRQDLNVKVNITSVFTLRSFDIKDLDKCNIYGTEMICFIKQMSHERSLD